MMITKRENKSLEDFYNLLIKREKFTYKEALKIYEAMHREAVSLGIISSKNIREGLEVDLRLRKILNRLDV